MPKLNIAQLTLLDLPTPTLRPRAKRGSPEMTARHSRTLLAELDRAVQAHHRRNEVLPATPSKHLSPAQTARMEHLARLFDAIEAVHALPDAAKDTSAA